MIEDLIETGQYKEALQYLNDMDNEQVRYQRLVCLYGLKELQQAKREGMKAKVLAGETYYDVVAIYVSMYIHVPFVVHKLCRTKGYYFNQDRFDGNR